MTDLTDEVVDFVLAKARAGDVPEEILRAAATNDSEIADTLKEPAS